MKTAKTYLRVPALCTLLALVVDPAYRAVLSTALAAGYSERFFFAATTLLIHTLLYVSINGFFFSAEAFGWFESYRFERKPYQRPTTTLLLRTWGEAFVSQVLTGPFVVWYIYLAFVHCGMPGLQSPLPSAKSMFLSFVVARPPTPQQSAAPHSSPIIVTRSHVRLGCGRGVPRLRGTVATHRSVAHPASERAAPPQAHLFNDFFFYWAHRLFHAKSLYKHVHKQHHSYNGSIGFAAEFAAPLEQVIANQLPSIGGCLFFGAHPIVFWVWLAARLQQTYEGHSGFCFYGTLLHRVGLTNSEGCAYHDYHHSGNRGNFGSQWLDWSFGTMDSWLALGGTEGYIEQCRKIREAQVAGGGKSD